MAGLASLLRRGRGFGSRIKRFPAPEVPGIPTSGEARRGRPDRQGWQTGGQVKGYSHGGPSIHSGHGSVSATPGMPGWMTTWKRGRTIGDLTGGGGRSIMPTRRPRGRGPVPTAPTRPTPPGGWQEGGPVGVAPEEVEMAAEIYAMATPEQQAQITGGGGPGMMDEEAAIGEALAMAMGGGGGGGPPMGGPPMNGAPPMGGLM